ncbi:MAG TPA: hypothetical protein VM686_07785 [Polyangiaceae bacterium]|nr:hypothetical protein [Polyangiaceae bacterium]
MSRRVLIALILCAGCGKFRENRECADFAQRVNAFISESKGKGSPNYANPAEVVRESRALAERYKKLDVDLSTLKIETAELRPPVESYRKLAAQAATALEGAAVALEKQDLELARTRRNDFDRAAKQEPALVKTINDLCAR